MKKTLILLLAGFLLLGTTLGAQEFSEKKDVAVFKINYFGAPAYAPKEVKISASLGDLKVEASLKSSGDEKADQVFKQTIAQVDSTISQSMQELGRFNIISMPQRLSTEDIDAFINTIKDYKSQNLVIPEAVSFGRQTFTVADYNKLVASFIVLVPTVTFYNLVFEDEVYKAEISTDIAVIDVSENKQIGRFVIETSGTDPKNDAKAMKAAVDSIPNSLIFELRKVPAFRISTGITDLRGGDVIIEFGKNMGLVLGDEYQITRQVQVGKYNSEEVAGLIVIKDVRDQYSIGQVIRSKGKPVIGDQLRELPRNGADLELYADLLLMDDQFGGLVTGFKAAGSRGFYNIRPIFGFDLLLSETLPLLSGYSSVYIPISMYLGAEYLMYFGPFKLVPQVGLGAIYYIDLENMSADDPLRYFTHLRTHAKAQLDYLVNDDMYAYAEAGVMGNLSLNSYVNSFSALMIGGGVSFKL